MLVKAKFHYAVAGSKLVRSWSQTGTKPNSTTLSASNQLRTSSEPDSVMEFGFKRATVHFITWICYTYITTFSYWYHTGMTGQNWVKFIPRKWNSGYATDLYQVSDNYTLTLTLRFLRPSRHKIGVFRRRSFQSVSWLMIIFTEETKPNTAKAIIRPEHENITTKWTRETKGLVTSYDARLKTALNPMQGPHWARQLYTVAKNDDHC